ncbi:MAG: metallophosphoesterase [Lentilactobacillus buchneri]|nr:metallophosphoesterase [Lentilactobacillus buchneri]MCI1950360.1 metallophosphoesterase [Lentilactobacillus buchneri]MCI2018509.1 metallophosphoesterase [Lentilactobacillus buchneri]MCI2027680.1 metallophosphoesterase [Lentilactobacillus buchneri]
MKILVISDNHGDRQIISDLMTHYDGEVDGFFHCGDSEFDSNDPLVSKMHIVRGNMDHAAFAEDEISKIDGETILLTHGHLHGVNSGLLTLELFARSKEANIVLFGHTHQLGVTQDQGILFVNPGSISLPRGQYAYIGGTYAIVSSKNNKLVVQYYDRKFNAVDELRFSF